MTGPLFDSYLIVDWSAAGTPKTGRDSIWWALNRRGEGLVRLENPATRQHAMQGIAAALRQEADAGRRVLAGFDFPFGYPVGVAARLTGGAGWQALWSRLAAALTEDAGNRSDRFAAASRLNAAWPTAGPFWGNGTRTDIPGLPRRKPAGWGGALPAEWRLVEAFQRARRGARPKSVWQLAGAGSVGSQVLTGIPRLERLRRDPGLAGRIAIWPFETGLATADTPICLAEVYPSLVAPIFAPEEAAAAARDKRAAVPDRAQVRTLAAVLAALDAGRRLGPLFAAAPDLDEAQRRAITREEAWILGAGHEEALSEARAAVLSRSPTVPARSAPATESDRAGRASGPERTTVLTLPHATPPHDRPLRYERDAAAIYRRSWEIVRAETRLDHLPEDLHEVAIRLVHACGMPDVANRLAWSADLGPAARAALAAGAPVLCDCEALASGIVRARLPAANPVVCTLNDPAAAARAEAIGNTRSAAAVELWRDRLAGALAVIGNAPTALYHLLELIDAGWPRPAAILAFPVGFVGAAESKAGLAARPRGIPFLTLRGRRGGSALAAAAVNALAAGLEAPR